MNPNIPKRPKPINVTKKQLDNGLLNLLINNDDRYDRRDIYMLEGMRW